MRSRPPCSSRPGTSDRLARSRRRRRRCGWSRQRTARGLGHAGADGCHGRSRSTGSRCPRTTRAVSLASDRWSWATSRSGGVRRHPPGQCPVEARLSRARPRPGSPSTSRPTASDTLREIKVTGVELGAHLRRLPLPSLRRHRSARADGRGDRPGRRSTAHADRVGPLQIGPGKVVGDEVARLLAQALKAVLEIQSSDPINNLHLRLDVERVLGALPAQLSDWLVFWASCQCATCAYRWGGRDRASTR